MEAIEVRITNHVKYASKYVYDFHGNKDLNEDYGTSYNYRHAKFRLAANKNHPYGKPKCEIFGGDVTDERILELVQKKYSNLKSKFVLATTKPQPDGIK